MSDYLSGFDDWTAAFAGWTDVSIHELHGLMTGVVCACKPPSSDEWKTLLSELSFSELPEAALDILTQYAEDVSFALKDKDDAYEYTPLVPDDEHELSERLIALKEWAGGFITGIGITDCYLKDDERELLSDLSKIASLRGLEDYDNHQQNYGQTELDDCHADDFLEEVDLEDAHGRGQHSAAEGMYLELFEFARIVPISLALRQKKAVCELALIKGLDPSRKTAKELALPPVTDVMS